jgi:hypothetical protein
MALVPEIIKASADPAAGGEIVYTADEDMTIHSLTFTLTTSAIVNNRIVTLRADDGNPANTFFWVSSPANHAASTTLPYSAVEGVPTATITGLILIALPALGLKLRKGDRLRTVTTLLDVGDNYTAMTIQAEREY